MVADLHLELGRMFREQIWAGRRLFLNEVRVEPFDPLFLRQGQNLVGAVPFGDMLSFPIQMADDRGRRRVSTVKVRFVELPVLSWHSLSSEEKRTHGIAKRAGVSVLRAGREIDSGWFFMGTKRRENYDDWWRCEVRFEPELDELFGVSHIKQGIRPSVELVRILSHDLERTAHDLNRRVRRTFAELRRERRVGYAATRAGQRDRFLSPPPSARRRVTTTQQVVGGLAYRVTAAELEDGAFFEPKLRLGELILAMNREHPFFDMMSADGEKTRDALKLLLLAAARAEIRYRGPDRRVLERFRRQWSTVLTAFLS